MSIALVNIGWHVAAEEIDLVWFSQIYRADFISSERAVVVPESSDVYNYVHSITFCGLSRCSGPHSIPKRALYRA